MDRRGFLGLLGSLPFLGFLKKKLEVPASVVKKARGMRYTSIDLGSFDNTETGTTASSSSRTACWVVDDKGSIVGFVGGGEYYSLLRK